MITRSLQQADIAPIASRLLSLQLSAYAIEAALIGDDRIPPLHETEQDLIGSPLLWFVVFDGECLAGALGYSIENEVVDIDRLMIDPEYHRRGLGRSLVTQVIQLARRAVVSTGRDNTPARRLYESLGFVHDGDFEPVEGLWVSRYALTRGADA